jgi:alkylation response protein AidB-like acyl-CoA dehydrogenase
MAVSESLTGLERHALALGVRDSAPVCRAARLAGFDAPAFRREVREFCQTRVPADLVESARRHQYYSKDQRVRWQRLLQKQGWFAPHWPQRFGGQDWGALRRLILMEELELAGTPWLAHFGITYLGPVLCRYGTGEQQARFLPGILDSETWWAQGFSEPGAGSDLGAVNLRAERTASGYRLNGQKTWTTMAQWADMIFCLVRTAQTARRSDGLSFLLVDMNAPGVSVRPIPTYDACRHVNEVFFADVEVPFENRIGEEGQGWEITKYLVQNERLIATEIGLAGRHLAGLQSRFAAQPDGVLRHLRRTLAELEVRYRVLRATAYGAAIAADEGRSRPEDASLLKIRGSELQKALLETMVEMVGSDGLVYQEEGLHRQLAQYRGGDPAAPGLVFEHLHSRVTSIYGGSNEIQRDIIARSLA